MLTLQVLANETDNPTLCIDSVISICSETLTAIPQEDRSVCRNQLMQDSQHDWNLWLQPWEEVIGGLNEITKVLNTTADGFYLYVITEGVVTKEQRLWRRSSGKKFMGKNQERLLPATDAYLPCYIRAQRRCLQETSNPYEAAMTQLWHGDVPGCMQQLHRVILNNEDTATTTLARYYLAQVQIARGEHGAALGQLVQCLTVQPLMAEFWCLLGDMFVRLEQYERAALLYDNAILFGKQRTPYDVYPVELDKYSSYPERMLKALTRR